MVPIRKNNRYFFRETNFVLRDHTRFPIAQLGLAQLLDNHHHIGERFGQADAALRVRRPRFPSHRRPYLADKNCPNMHEGGTAVKWEFPTSGIIAESADNGHRVRVSALGNLEALIDMPFRNGSWFATIGAEDLCRFHAQLASRTGQSRLASRLRTGNTT
jgi:hypothetical protein